MDLEFKRRYIEEIRPHLHDSQEFGTSIMGVPRLEKITLNMGVGQAAGDKKILGFALDELTNISGQKAVQTLAKKSISGFKIRQGWPIGCKVVLRRDRMYGFLQRLIDIALPRIRDFRGFSLRGFDGRGNYSLGIREQIIFPEIEYDKVDSVRGFDVTLTTSAINNRGAYLLLKGFSFPFRRDEKIQI